MQFVSLRDICWEKLEKTFFSSAAIAQESGKG